MILPILLLALLQAAPRRQAVPVQRGVTVTPETVTVGDPFRVSVRIHAPAGATIGFPDAPDTAAAMEAVDPRIVKTTSGADGTDQTAAYRIVAWDVGSRPVGLGDVVVRAGAAQTRVSLADLRVFVRSVLPADSAKRVPKPARPVFERPFPWWLVWVLLAAALALIGLLFWWWWRRRRRETEWNAAANALSIAHREFDRIEALGLIEAGERGRFVALMVEVLREYLARRVPEASASLTTTELVAALRANRDVPIERLGALLGEADLIKFARRVVTADRAQALGREARGLVEDVERARVATAAAAAAAAAAPPPELAA